MSSSPSRQVLSELSATIAYHQDSVASRSQQGEWDAAIQKLRAEAARQIRSATNGREHSDALGTAEESHDALDQEALANKTYSCTSVQNVHVTSSLPRSLDGAVEANLRKINSPGKGSNKTKSPKSPRTIFRSTGDAWFGPFRRNFYDTKSKEGEDDVSRFGRVR